MIPIGISGSAWTTIDDGYSVAQTTAKEGLDFINNKKSLHDYILDVSNEYAEFIFKDSDVQSKRNQPLSNVVQDLNYRVIFFNYLNIGYTTDNTSITFTLNLDTLTDVYRSKFLTLVNDTNGSCDFYITEINNVNGLITKLTVDLYQLHQQTTMSYPCIYDKPVSVWALRK